jgi:hypothetical protein
MIGHMDGEHDLNDPVRLLFALRALYRETVSASDPLERQDEWEALMADVDSWFRWLDECS